MGKDGIYFLHIPKCAGTSFRTWMENNFHRDDILSLWDDVNISRIPPSVLRTKKCISSHSGWWPMDYLENTHRVVTVLRDPVERTVSSYRYILQTSHHMLSDTANRMDILDFFRHPRIRRYMANWQTRHLAFQSIQESTAVQEYDTPVDKEYFVNSYDENSLEIAKENIRNIDFLGTSKTVNELMHSICHFYGWYPPERLPKFNITQAEFTANTTPEVLDEIRSINLVDQAVYDFAIEEIKRRDLQKFSRDETISKFIKRMNMQNRQSGDFRFDFNDQFSGEGWYGRESEQNGYTVRWTGPENSSSVYVCFDSSSDYNITMMASSYIPEIIDGIEIYANGEKLPLSLYQPPNLPTHTRIVSARIDAASLSANNGTVHFRIDLPRTVIPHEINSADPDRRALGVYVHWLDFIKL
ncbi:sulfotransferase family protein [Azospirillum brasilense]|uniref:Sulfotransferase family protein n=1 Tax=Azospirillum brasilense TaxID=192 RepID=A0A560BWN2_AZOBR|nr:sulfotransferase family 2 domain-containing protein [Azospirillum brasilense]TWA77018.1 sulfotransferase family protein [Azospirillum brasilense]